MTHLLEAQLLSAPLAHDAAPRGCASTTPVEAWAESEPEAFLREVAAALSGILGEGPLASAPKTGDSPPES
jgi:hypothetical protein